MYHSCDSQMSFAREEHVFGKCNEHIRDEKCLHFECNSIIIKKSKGVDFRWNN